MRVGVASEQDLGISGTHGGGRQSANPGDEGVKSDKGTKERQGRRERERERERETRLWKRQRMQFCGVKTTLGALFMGAMSTTELILHVVALIQGGQAWHLADTHATDPPNTSLKLKQATIDSLYISQIATSVSLLSLVVIVVYYRLARRILERLDRVAEVQSSKLLATATYVPPVSHVPSVSSLLVKLLIIALGAFGLVAIAIAATSNGTLLVWTELLVWTDKRDEMVTHVTSITIYTSVCGVLKLGQTLLGHWWGLYKERLSPAW